MQRIALLVAYFGKMPAFYKAWELSAMANDTIDFYVFTDDVAVKEHKNIFVKRMTFQNFRSLIQEKIEFEISLNTPYKLCDYKPSYGYVFCDLLKEYDWWGYCDIDMVLGDIRKFLNESVLNEYERCQRLGHICIYKNCEKINTLFKFKEEGYPAINYETVYTTNESMYFDEARGLLPKCIINRIALYCDETFRDPLEGERKFIYNKENVKNNYVVFWEQGKLYCVYKDGQKVELMYAHFFRRKFNVYECFDEISTIKIAPKEVCFNSEIVEKDFSKSEIIFYKYLYKVKNAYKSIKRYGLRRTIERQRWTRDHNNYIETLKKDFSS